MKRWVQLAIVSMLLVASVNIGILNWHTLEERERLNRIGMVSQMGDQMLYQGLVVMDTRTKDLAEQD